MENHLAPISLFTYNRLWHTRQTIQALQKNKLAQKSNLFIFSDGPKNSRDKKQIQAVRNYLKTITEFKTVKIIERQQNIGLAHAIISGVSKIINHYGKIIVLEDDLITSPYFLNYMNEALDLYQDEKQIISIHGYIYPIKDLPGTFFLKGADCWGWATWKRGWELFESDGQKLLTELKKKGTLQEFDFNRSYPYAKMLERQIKGKNDSWAIRWYASAFLQNKLTLYPGRSLVQNIGLDDTGTHCGNSDKYKIQLSEKPINLNNIPIQEDLQAKQKIEKYFKSLKQNIFHRVIKKCKLKK